MAFDPATGADGAITVSLRGAESPADEEGSPEGLQAANNTTAKKEATSARKFMR
ncbi:MAG: hypothetical protein JSR34_01040 [Proteobacteria bacterium]|nr:hypothetical protein [Pseudomonadota bacterium]